MPRDQRVACISKLEKARKSRIISIFLGDRPGAETRIAADLLPRIAQLLRSIGKQKRIDIALYSLGGDIMTGYRAVSLIREYCDHFAVLVPFKCQSTATLISLGADEIVMLPEGQLSPVDPSINGPYNPPIPGVAFQPGMPLPVLPVSVEEVVSYVRLAEDVAGLKGEAGLVTVFERLTQDVRPLALGQVYRARTQIRMLSKRLLENHMKTEDAERIEAIVATLTEKLYSHDYLISRHEAKTLGLPVVDASGDVEVALVQLYELYVTDLALFQPFNPIFALQGSGKQQDRITIERAFVETTSAGDVFMTDRSLALQPGGGVAEQIHYEGWKPL